MPVLTRVGRNGVPQHIHRIVGHPTVWHPVSRFHRNDILAHTREGADQPEWVGARRDETAFRAAIAFAERTGRVLRYTDRVEALRAQGFTAEAAATLAQAGNTANAREALATATATGTTVQTAVAETVASITLAPSARQFGVELEVYCDRYTLEDALRSRGLRVRGENYNHNTVNHWKITTDGSLNSGGVELVSPPLSGEDGFNQLRLACEALRACNATVNRSCGMHVHVEVRDFDGPACVRLARAYTEARHTIDGWLAPSRHGNSYCQHWTDSALRNCASARTPTDVSYNQGGRYRTVNFEAFPRQGTVEFRQHQGTTDYGKASAWVRFVMGMCDAAARGAFPAGWTATASAETLAGLLGLDNRDSRYFTRRTEYFRTGRVA